MTRHTPLIFVLLMMLTVMFSLSVMIGPAGLGLRETIAALIWGQGEAATLVMREIRLPRAILALLVGASLGLAGAAMQGYLRNPLAEPGFQPKSSPHQGCFTRPVRADQANTFTRRDRKRDMIDNRTLATSHRKIIQLQKGHLNSPRVL